jgi:hypothetical protein
MDFSKVKGYTRRRVFGDGSMKPLKELLQQSQQKSYMLGNMFAEGDWIKNSDGQSGKIHRRGVNYVIAVTEEGEMFRAWVKDIKEHCGKFLTNPESMKEHNESGNVDRAMSFINKYKKKDTESK